MALTEPERPAQNWKYPYVAAAVDFGSNLRVSVSKASDTSVGYRISPQLHFTNTDKTSLGFLDEFCEQHDITPTLREDGSSYRLEVNRRDDLERLFRLVQPYLIGRHPESEILLKNLLPGLQMGKHSSKEGFLKLVQHADRLRAESGVRKDVKYDEGYFRDEWEV